MGLSNSNISIMAVRNTIGCPSTDLGTLIAKAKTGGKSGFAFSIKENGGYESDGVLIEGASPYWNIYSPHSPGEWVAAGLVPGTVANNAVAFRLKRTEGSKYGFSLGAFRNYDHDAAEPDPGTRELSFVQYTGSGQLSYNASVRAGLGSYDWSGVSEATHWRIVVLNGSSVFATGTPELLSTNNASMVVPMVINTNSLTTYTYKTKIEIGTYSSNNFTSRGYLPGEGNLKITIYKEKPRYSLFVKAGNSWRAFDIPETYTDAGKKLNFRGTYNLSLSIETLGKTLVRATYDITDEQGNILRTSVFSGSQLDYTHESPLTLNRYIQGDNVEIFAVPKDRVTLGNNEYVEVSFEYE